MPSDEQTESPVSPPSAANDVTSALLGKLNLDRTSTVDRVADLVRELIMFGHLAPGTALREVLTAGALGVSRNTVREALRVLGQEGLVVHNLHRGVVVKTLTADDVRDIYTARSALEMSAVARSDRATPQQLAALDATVHEAELAAEAADWSAVTTHELLFHQRLIEILDSRRLDAFFRALLSELRLAYAMADDLAAYHTRFVPWNRRVCDLVVAGDRRQAARRLERYLNEGQREAIDFVERGAA
jgi:DNA-binding GntR family transcriptional regulator